MLKIGLTGGIGSGKSEVSKFFHSWGAYIFDADKEAKDIINNNIDAQKEIIKEFGIFKKEFENFSNSTEELRKKASAMIKVIDEHETREKQMSRSVERMEKFKNNNE